MTYLQRYFHNTNETDRHAGAIAFYASLDQVATVAPSVSCAILQELRDETSHLKLIASENFSSLAVQQAMGNLLTDKYAEGIPHRRFYAGCDNVDAVEAEAVNELKLLFGCDHAYAQPHSGADANMIAFWGILSHRVESKELERLGKKNINELSDAEYEQVRQLLINQRVMGMSLDSGGHLTHGYRLNLSSKMMQAANYHVDPSTGLLDYDQIAVQVKEFRPAILLAGYSAYPRKIDFARMREIADSVGATFMVDMAHFCGLVAGKAFVGESNPVPYADVLTSTTHKTLRGPRGGIVLCRKEYAEAINKGCPMVMGGPLPHVMAAKAVAFKEAGTYAFQAYAYNVIQNAKTLAEELMKLGVLVATNGTDNHLLLFDVTSFGLTGRQAESALRAAHITVNRNALPGDVNGPWYTSGIRIGTPALTTLGMGEEEMRLVAKLIVEILKNTKPEGESKAKFKTDEKTLEKVIGQVRECLYNFPLYPELDMEGTWSKRRDANDRELSDTRR